VDRVEHSLSYYAALKKAGVPVEMHLYAQGGHAFGLRRTKFPATTWPPSSEVVIPRITFAIGSFHSQGRSLPAIACGCFRWLTLQLSCERVTQNASEEPRRCIPARRLKSLPGPQPYIP